MIKIHRPPSSPAILTGKGAKRRDQHCQAYKRSPDKYRTGKRKFAFDAEIYAHASVKKALKLAQHEKCAFCEAKVTHISYGDVEHFRPKAGTRQARGEPLTRPGYYWLAYDWNNLFLCCQLCNQRFKRNYFPLQDPARRAQTHEADVGLESPVFIDPARDDPAKYIGFREEFPYAINNNRRARKTIRSLGLRRKELTSARRERLETLRALYRLAYGLSEQDARKVRAQIAEARALLKRSIEDTAEYSSMMRAAIASWSQAQP
jgi:uncharacterized protein (TIGR02646 family)